MKFKVGDKVKILWEKTPYLSDRYADKGEIVGILEKRGVFCDNYWVRGFNKTHPLDALPFKDDELILLEEEKQTMKKSDLKQGALVQMRNGNVYILIGKKFVNLTDGEYMPLEKYDNDLYFKTDEYDIVKVFDSSFEHEGYYYYIRNVGEIEKILEILLGYKVKIIKEETNE